MTWTQPSTHPSPVPEADAPREEDMYKCVHCGFCLQACPTYLETGLETESPRGRIALMKAVNEGRIGITPGVYRHWDLCIQCRACEAACPSGVPYGNLIEAVNSQVEQIRSRSLPVRLAGRLALNVILPRQRRLELLALGLRLYQESGLQWAVRKTRILSALAPGLAELETSAPTISKRRLRARGQVIPAAGAARVRAAMFSGCIMPLMHGPQMAAAMRVLARNGCEVEVTKGQACCGAIHSHVGDLPRARDLARQNIDAFENRDVDALVVASAGCGARMKEYGHLLRDDPDYAERAERFWPNSQRHPRVPRRSPLHSAHRGNPQASHLPRLLPPRERPAHNRCSKDAADVHTRHRVRRDGAVEHLLRRRRDIYHHREGVFPPRPRFQNAACTRDGCRVACDREPRLRPSTSIRSEAAWASRRSQVHHRYPRRRIPRGGKMIDGYAGDMSP